jgi:hypothetical protein
MAEAIIKAIAADPSPSVLSSARTLLAYNRTDQVVLCAEQFPSDPPAYFAQMVPRDFEFVD